MSKLPKVKAYIEQGMSNSDICKTLGLAPAYVSTVRHRMGAGVYDENREADPKCSDGDEHRKHYEEIQLKKEAAAAAQKYCVRLKTVRGKVMECGNPSHGRTYCQSCREELLFKSRRHTMPGTVTKVKANV